MAVYLLCDTLPASGTECRLGLEISFVHQVDQIRPMIAERLHRAREGIWPEGLVLVSAHSR